MSRPIAICVAPRRPWWRRKAQKLIFWWNYRPSRLDREGWLHIGAYVEDKDQ